MSEKENQRERVSEKETQRERVSEWVRKRLKERDSK